MPFQGVSNVQLVKEGHPLAKRYQNRSVAEQNSVDLAWKMLMADDYTELRNIIYTNEAEKQQFRNVVVNVSTPLTFFSPAFKAILTG